jgi:four helix bundle protein
VAVKTYQELIAWQKGIALVTEVYEATRSFPRDEIYGLTSQLRRAAVSIPSNIAEGQGRASSGEFVQFLCHARGSLYEVETQVIVASNLKYLSQTQRDSLDEKISELGRILNGLITSIETRKKRLATSH